MIVAMIMAMDENKLIGSDGGLPWHIPSELQYFKALTMGKPMIMGRSTWESIGRPLPGRTSIVVTTNTHYAADGAIVVHSLDEAIEHAQSVLDKSPSDVNPEAMIIGGAALCEAAMPITDKLYLTLIKQVFDGDTWLSSFVETDWIKESSSDLTVDGIDLSYQVLVRSAG